MEYDKTEIASFFDACALRGDMAGFSPEDSTRVDALIDLWGIRPGERVLEVGCGAGRLTERLARRIGADGEILAMDLSAEMIRKAESRGLPENVHFAQGDICAVPRDDAWFDCVICFSVLPHLRPLWPAIAEMARVARVGARLWLCHLMSSEDMNHFHRHVGTVVADHHIPEFHILEKALLDAGFRTVGLADNPDDGYRFEAVRVEGEKR